MGDNTHSVTVSANNRSDTGMVHVPASVQREQGISIDDEVEVTIEGLQSVFESVSFVGAQRCGDAISVPAELMRKVNIEPKEQYNITFEKVESDDADGSDDTDGDGSTEDLDDQEFAISDGEVDEILDDLEGELEEQASETVADEQEEEGIGQLFG